MNTAAIIGASAFSIAFLGCLQSINVSRGHRLPAGITSLLIGMAQLTLYRTVPHVDSFSHGAVFVLCGLVGAQLSMTVAARIRKT